MSGGHVRTHHHSVGVIVGRFQTPYLHAGHRNIIERVREANDQVFVILGYTGGLATEHDPLDYVTRRAMIQAAYPDLEIGQLRDVGNDGLWSEDLDALIASRFMGYSVTLYGSRDSFVPHYSGKFPAVVVQSPPSPSGTNLRDAVAPSGDEGFRRGVIWASKRTPVSYQAVDVAIVRPGPAGGAEVLMGFKRGDDGRRFIGGFVDPADESLEAAARREAHEETSGLGLDGFLFLGSFRVQDWRYRDSKDAIMSALFLAYYQFGNAEPADDIDELAWVEEKDLVLFAIQNHKALAERVARYLKEVTP
jgi:bifunctional NMN adenylyltransferase/nudix hydrolase